MLETLFLLGLSTHRLSYLWLTQEIFRPAREGFSWLGPRVRFFVNCPICVSVWSGFIVYTLWNVSWLGQLIVWGLGLSLMTAFVHVIMTHLESFRWALK